MNQEVLEEILGCPTLPSLPEVAVRVIELTENADVRMDDLSRTIQNDQGLAAKVLRTVNSSFYGLRRKCSTINQALVLLGMASVKTLALGFSLVSSLSKDKDDGFDYVAYWRLGIYSAVGAKIIAGEVGRSKIEDEAFLGGLLQDIGVMAMHKALGARYGEVLARTGGDHRRLVKCEIDEFEVQHPDIGAMLAKRWKLPDELVMPVRYHERPTAAPLEWADVVRCVHLGNLAHDVVTCEDTVAAVRQFHKRAGEWYDLTPSACDDILTRVAGSAKEIAAIFRLDTGPAADAEEILATAAARMVEMARVESRDPSSSSTDLAGEGMAKLTVDGDRVEPLTGALRRPAFEAALAAWFSPGDRQPESLSLLLVCVDGLEALVKMHGVEAGDEAMLGTVALLRKHFDPMGAVVGRFAADTFAVAASGQTQIAVLRAAGEFRADLARSSAQWRVTPDAPPLPVTVSVGTAAAAPGSAGFDRPQQLLAAAMRAVQASRAGGGNAVRAFVAKAA